MHINRYYLLIFLITLSAYSYCQDIDSSAKSPQLPKDYYSKVDKKIKAINVRLEKKSVKYLERFQKQEKKVQQNIKRLRRENAIDAVNNTGERYKKLLNQIKSVVANANEATDGIYNSYIDSLGTSLSFLKQFKNTGDKARESLASLNRLQNKLYQSEKIKEFIAERKNHVKELLSAYAKIPGNLKKGMDNLNRTAYYYSVQVKEYKDMLNDPKKAEQKALNILTRLPAFQKFIKQNGQLASLFRINANADPAQSLAGLQTRISVQETMQQKITAGGPNASQLVQQNIAVAKAEVDKIKNKIIQSGGGASDIEIPGFKPNSEKTKSFLKRLEYSANVQFAKTSNLMPSAADIAVGVGYKLNNRSAVGIGVSYKMGTGRLSDISITSQGLGLRSYIDWKIKKQIYLSCGYEMNYNTTFKNIQQLNKYEAWQRSALAGISKKYKISKKIRGEIKLLYDFLANQQVPVGEPFLVRAGYKF